MIVTLKCLTFDQAKVICLCGYDGVRDYFGIRITEEKVVWVNNHTELGALAFEGTVLDNISIVFEEESFTLECDKLTRYIDPKFYEDKTWHGNWLYRQSASASKGRKEDHHEIQFIRP